MMKIFICSPYQGNIEENKKKAAYYAKIVAKAGNVPVAPHIYFPTFLDEKNPNERRVLKDHGRKCHPLWIYRAVH